MVSEEIHDPYNDIHWSSRSRDQPDFCDLGRLESVQQIHVPDSDVRARTKHSSSVLHLPREVQLCPAETGCQARVTASRK